MPSPHGILKSPAQLSESSVTYSVNSVLFGMSIAWAEDLLAKDRWRSCLCTLERHFLRRSHRCREEGPRRITRAKEQGAEQFTLELQLPPTFWAAEFWETPPFLTCLKASAHCFYRQRGQVLEKCPETDPSQVASFLGGPSASIFPASLPPCPHPTAPFIHQGGHFLIHTST